MKKRLLVLGGSRQAKAGLVHLKSCGYELVVCDYDTKAPGFDVADHKILASVYHFDQCLPAVRAFHQHTPIDGVMCIACDVPHIVARIAAELNVPGLPIEVADRAVNKLVMKQKFAGDGIAIPRFWMVETAAAIREIHETHVDNLVVKPVDSRGSKGVSRLKAGENADWSFEYARDNSPSGQVMVEEYLAGPQVSTESVVIGGQAVTPALSDRRYEFLERYYPFIVENGGDMPSKLGDAVTEKICNLVEQAAASLGVVDGIVKGDIVVHDGSPYVIELAARLSGGYFCTHQIPFSTDINLVEACAEIALGNPIQPEDWQPQKHDFVSTRWKIIEAGEVVYVPPVENITAMPGVLTFEHWLTPGDEITAAQNAAASIAMVQATGETRAQAIERAEKALEAFEPTVRPIN